MLERTQFKRVWRYLGLAVGLVGLVSCVGCAVRRTTWVQAPAASAPLPAVRAADLVAEVNRESQAVRTMTATVELEPTAGSVYSGVIKEYRDVRGFILLESPDHLRIVGQAPVVRTTLFDMVADGEEFKLSIPPKGKFIVGKTKVTRPAKNTLENLRPEHILLALQLAPIDPESEKYFVDQEGDPPSRVLNVLESAADGQLTLQRKIWFDGLQISRLQLYDSGGALVEDVRYSDYRDFASVRYPARIEVSRKIEDYRLGINIEKATFNQPIPPEKFQLQKPPGAEVVELGAAEPVGRVEAARGQ